MKIIYVDMLYDYGLKERGLNIIGQEGFLKNFIDLGFEVHPFYYDEYLNPPNFPQLQTEIKKFADQISPDAIFFLTYIDQFDIETLDYLRSKYTTIAWFGDDTWRFDNYTKNYANHYTYCITTDKFSIQKYKEIGQKNVIYSQWAAINTSEMPDFNKEYDYDVSFVGGWHPHREWFIEELKKRNIKVTTFGNGWKNGPVSSKRMNEIFSTSKINLNLSNSTDYDFRYILNDYDNISNKLWLRYKIGSKVLKSFKNISQDSKNREQVKARHFEIPYFYGFQLSYYYSGIVDYFHIGKEIACFKNIDEAEFLINYYLNNEDEREQIKQAGHKIVINKHSYKNRLEEIFEYLNKKEGI